MSSERPPEVGRSLRGSGRGRLLGMEVPDMFGVNGKWATEVSGGSRSRTIRPRRARDFMAFNLQLRDLIGRRSASTVSTVRGWDTVVMTEIESFGRSTLTTSSRWVHRGIGAPSKSCSLFSHVRAWGTQKQKQARGSRLQSRRMLDTNLQHQCPGPPSRDRHRLSQRFHAI